MKNGFTMIELIFIIVILCILAAVTIPKMVKVREEANAKELTDLNDINKTQIVKTTPRGKVVAPIDKDYPNTIYTAPKN